VNAIDSKYSDVFIVIADTKTAVSVRVSCLSCLNTARDMKKLMKRGTVMSMYTENQTIVWRSWRSIQDERRTARARKET